MIPQSVAGALFSLDRSQILLIKRRDVPVWVLPGGGIEPDETPEEAIIREMMEETGIRVKIARLAGAYTALSRLARDTHLYDLAPLSGHPTLSAETRAVRFFPLDALPPLPPPYLEWIHDAHRPGPPLHKRLTRVTIPRCLPFLFRHPLLVLRFLLSRIGLHINT